jgi:hypothetical protein
MEIISSASERPLYAAVLFSLYGQGDALTINLKDLSISLGWGFGLD